MVFGEDIPTWRGTGRRFWWLGSVATAALYTAVGVYVSWIAAGSIVSDERTYGPIGR